MSCAVNQEVEKYADDELAGRHQAGDELAGEVARGELRLDLGHEMIGVLDAAELRVVVVDLLKSPRDRMVSALIPVLTGSPCDESAQHDSETEENHEHRRSAAP
jgi:hypothetical protein